MIAVHAVVQRLLQPGARFTDKDGETRPLLAKDVFVIAPFNRHVDALARGLGAGAKVGTVDKLQGQEVPGTVSGLRLANAHVRLVGLGVKVDRAHGLDGNSGGQALHEA